MRILRIPTGFNDKVFNRRRPYFRKKYTCIFSFQVLCLLKKKTAKRLFFLVVFSTYLLTSSYDYIICSRDFMSLKLTGLLLETLFRAMSPFVSFLSHCFKCILLDLTTFADEIVDQCTLKALREQGQCCKN